MRVITRRRLVEFWEIHPDAEEALNIWYMKTLRSDWSSLADIKEVFNSVDYVGNDQYVFNIRGNKYRVVARIFFHSKKIVYIRFVGTHTKYDKIDCATI